MARLGVKMETTDVAGAEADRPLTERPAPPRIFPSLFFSSTGAPTLFSFVEIWHPPSSSPPPMALFRLEPMRRERRRVRPGVAAAADLDLDQERGREEREREHA